MTNCAHCGGSTKNKKYCSRSCANTVANRTPKKKRNPVNFCDECGKQNRRKDREVNPLCSTCDPSHTLDMVTLGELKRRRLERDRRPNDIYIDVRNHSRHRTKHMARACTVCGYDKVVHVAHIKGIASFDVDSTVREINDLSNLTFLCPNHHWEFDNLTLSGYVPLSELLPS